MATDVGADQEAFADLRFVVDDDRKFIAKLGIGADAYATLRAARVASDATKIGAAAAAGAAVAASGPVAATFFAGSGWLAALGLGAAAATPLGWVAAAGVVTGAGYFGVLRLFQAYEATLIDSVPRFINTPIDLLGAAIVDMLGGIGLCVAQSDGAICDREREHIAQYFVREWGVDAGYAKTALAELEANLPKASLAERVDAFLGFVRENPDCKLDALKARVRDLLEALAACDGRVAPGEKAAIDAVMRQIAQNRPGAAGDRDALRKTWLGHALIGLDPENARADPAVAGPLPGA